MALDSKTVSDPRLAHFIEEISLKNLRPARSEAEVILFCHPDDEGVRLNGGRIGAKEGPSKILKYLERMVLNPHLTPQIYRLKDLKPEKSLAARHSKAEEIAKKIFSLGYRLITLGGGHDYGFPDASAYYESTRGAILNIDAHLDVRPVIQSKLNSGTPFFRFLEKFGGQDVFAWGIQPQCNSLVHLKWAKERGMQIFDYMARMPRIEGPVGLSVDLDAFEGIRGVSAPAFVGLMTSDGIEAIHTYAPQSRWLGLYESAPRYDPINEDSARLAATFAYHFIHRFGIHS